MKRTLLALLMMMPTTALAADLDLYVTDYNENPSPEQKPMVDGAVNLLHADEVTVKVGGKTVTYKNPNSVSIRRSGAGDPRLATLCASPGEYEPFSFLLRPKENLEQVFIAAGEFKGPAGSIPAANVKVTSVEGFHGAGRDILMPLGAPWNMSAHAAEYFWCTVQVPEDAKPGTYAGDVTVTAKGQAVGRITVRLDVLPIHLEDVPFALGYNYSNPKDDKALHAHLADMRAHGMTTVAALYGFHLPVHDSDTGELGRFIEAYKTAGYPAVFYFATPMDLELTDLAGYGAVTSRRWQQKYIEVMRRLNDEVVRHGVPALMSIGDEFTNRGIEGVKIAEQLARLTYEELPEIAVTSDMDGFMEVMAMAPYLNVATFNNGWDGADHHNQGRRLLNAKFLQELQEKTHAIPWFVNAGTGRFPFGLFFWKMTRHGVRGKVEWYYNLGNNERGSVVRTDGERIHPTLDYERSREGIDDLKYLGALEKLLAEARKAGKAADEARKAEAVLKGIADSLHDDWTIYDTGTRFSIDGFGVADPEKAASLGPLDSVRQAVAERILALQSAMR